MPLQNFMQNAEASFVRKSAASMLSGKRPAVSFFLISFLLPLQLSICLSPTMTSKLIPSPQRRNEKGADESFVFSSFLVTSGLIKC